MSAVVLEDVRRRYRTAGGHVEALSGVDLTVEAAETVAIIGPSGCGKSTLLSMVGGLERPSAGRVEVFGEELAGLSDGALAAFRRTHIGFVFQSYDLLPYMTAAENVAIQAGIAGRSAADAPEMLGRVGLGEHGAKLPDQLSGGQKQRVGIARALAHSPALVLADEPTGSLDAETSEAVITTLLALVREAQSTLLLVTHDAAVALRCDRVVRLRDGRVVDQDAAVQAG
ncbi:MAG TPA: ABC transporter ATP-binding protein [Candidatus Dormibacteraeota bacterium]